MSAEEKYNPIFDVLAKAKEREGLDLVRLHEEIRKKIEGGDETFAKFLEVVKAFRDIIPKEKQRYNAAVKALSATSGQSLQDIIDSTDSQIEELNLLEKVVFSALSCLRDDLDAMESRAKMIKSEMAKLREQIGEFEREEQRLLGSMAAREGEIKVAEEKVRKIFKDVGTELNEIKNKIVRFSAEDALAEPATPPEAIDGNKPEHVKGRIEIKVTPPREEMKPIESKKRGTARESVGTDSIPAPQEAKWTKECPMCRGRMNLHISEAMWVCYSCGHEELLKDDTAGASEVNVSSESSVPEPAVESVATEQKPPVVTSESSGKRRSVKKRPCPVCHKQMNMQEEENTWKCPFCDYQRREF